LDPPRRLIADYLQTHPGSFCVACLAQALGVPASQISMVRHRLRATEGFNATRAACSGCRNTRIVIKVA
jgi:hypothetical protein